MRIFWYQGGLHIEPEGSDDQALLVNLSQTKFTWGRPEEHPNSGPGELLLELGGESLMDFGAGRQEVSPGSLTSQPNHQKAVISIGVAHKVVTKLDRIPRSLNNPD